MEVGFSHADELPVVAEPIAPTALSADIASEGTPIPVEAEPACTEARSSSGEPETSEAPVEEAVAITEPELEPIPQPTTAAVESELGEELATTVEMEAAELDSAEDTAVIAGAAITAAEPTAESITPVAVEETAIEEAVEALDQPVASTEPETAAFIPEDVLAPVEAAIEPVVVLAQSEEDIITENTELEVPTGTAAAVEEGFTAANDSITIEPTQAAVSGSEPATPTETGCIAVAEPEVAAVVPEIPTVVEPEPVELEVEESIVETIRIDVEPPSSRSSFIQHPEVGFVVSDEEPQTPIYEEAVTSVSDESALESTEESKPQEVVAFEEPSVGETSAVEEVVPVDLIAPTREPTSAEETIPAEEPILEGTVQVEEVVTAPTGELEVVADAPPVDDIAPVEDTPPTEDATSIESADSMESTPPVEEAIEASELMVDTLATRAEELEVPVVGEALTSVEVNNDEQPPHHIEETVITPEEILVPVGDISITEEQRYPTVDAIATSVEEEDIPMAEELSPPAPTEEDTPAFEEPPAPAPVEEDILAAEELSVPPPVEVDTPTVDGLSMPAPLVDIIPVVENSPVPAPIEDVIPVVEELPTPAPVEDVVPAVEDPPIPAPVEDVVLEDSPVSTPNVEVNAIVEEPPVPPVEVVVSVVEELPISAPVEEVSPAEEPPSPTLVEGTPVEESPESVVVEGEEQMRVAVGETPLPEEQPEVVEQTEETLVASVEINEECLHAEVPPSLTGRLLDEATTEVSLEVPINEELVNETPAESAIIEEELVGVSQAEEPADADAIHPETNDKDLEPSTAMAETSSEIEEVTDQQEVCLIPLINYVPSAVF